jgi:hypothetical protein
MQFTVAWQNGQLSADTPDNAANQAPDKVSLFAVCLCSKLMHIHGQRRVLSWMVHNRYLHGHACTGLVWLGRTGARFPALCQVPHDRIGQQKVADPYPKILFTHKHIPCLAWFPGTCTQCCAECVLQVVDKQRAHYGRGAGQRRHSARCNQGTHLSCSLHVYIPRRSRSSLQIKAVIVNIVGCC